MNFKNKLPFWLIIFVSFQALVIAQETIESSKLKWQGEIPGLAKDINKWKEFLGELEEKKFSYGMMAASVRVILFFDDVSSQGFGYENLIKVIDLGYPNSLLHMFILGNVQTESRDEVSQTYNFYKAVVNKIKKMDKWSTDYFDKIDKENLNKYLFYQAILLYSDKKFRDAQVILEKILRSPLRPKDFAFAKKVARTLARMHFEEQNYEKSLMWYDDFLLKVNPITPTDWLEKAWNLYYLKRNDLAIGTLYNMNSKAAKDFKTFEKYIIRALIYLNNCAINHVGELVKNFEAEFKNSIVGIVRGKQLYKLSEIEEVARFSNPQYKESLEQLEHLKKEFSRKSEISSDHIGLFNYLYRSEMTMLEQFTKFYKEVAYQKAAEDLTMLNESLKFLQYGTAREKYNPAVVFMPREKIEEDLVRQIDMADRGFLFNWLQQGQFWRDERNKYVGKMEDQCDEI
ncbi:MAG: hypothetical protein QE271_03545 [Bacteriovoracaceae bacterium]|nr:hypothetical protein [Bacteriovoracaceae bacterium]